MTQLEWAFEPDDFNSFTNEEKLINISNRLNSIYQYESRKTWRKRFSTDEQFEDEYPPEHETMMYVAFRQIKQSYDNNCLSELREENLVSVVWLDMLDEFISQDVDKILLEDEDN